MLLLSLWSVSIDIRVLGSSLDSGFPFASSFFVVVVTDIMKGPLAAFSAMDDKKLNRE